MALFDLARDAGDLDAVGTDLDVVEALLEASDDLRRLLVSPLFARDVQARAIDAVLADVARVSDIKSVSDLTRRFVGVLAANGRLDRLASIITDFRRLHAAHEGEVTAEVTSAHTLTDKQLDALRDKLRTLAGGDVKLVSHVDKSLLGGLVVKLGSRMVDSSLKTKLNNLQVAMKEVG